MSTNHVQTGRKRGLPALEGGLPVRSRDNPLIFGAPVIGEAEVAAVTDCLRSRWIGLGARVARFEEEFAHYKGARFAAAVSSGTAALHLALLALDIGPGDEVIAPTMTFCSTVHAIVHSGAKPVLVDCDPVTFNMDPAQLESKVGPRTKAILAVHMCGRCCDMQPILEVARRHGLRIIEDCAHSIESEYHGQPAGLIGDAGCFSFYATKNLTTGDGGMVIAKDQGVVNRVKRLSLHGMDADAWLRTVRHSTGYQVTEAGFKYNMTDLEASLGSAQLVPIDERWRQREKLWNLYAQQLKEFPVVLPAPPEPGTRHAYHLYTLLLRPETLTVDRDTILAAMRAENIGVGIHYVPVHRHPYYQNLFGFQAENFPNASKVGETTLSIPLAADLTSADLEDVGEALRKVLGYYSSSAADTVFVAAKGAGAGLS